MLAAGHRQPQRPQRGPRAGRGRPPRACRAGAVELQMLYGMGDRLGRRWSRAARACASTCPTASCSPAWRTWCAGCWRTPPTSRSCGRSFAEVPDDGAAGRPADRCRRCGESGAGGRGTPAAHQSPVSAPCTPVSQRAGDRLRPSATPRAHGRPPSPRVGASLGGPAIRWSSAAGGCDTRAHCGAARTRLDRRETAGQVGRRRPRRGRRGHRRRHGRLPRLARHARAASGPHALLRRRPDARRGRVSSWPPGRCYESGKPWREADADVCRGDRLLRVLRPRDRSRLSAPRRLGRARRERTTTSTSRAAWPSVIAPWNFPLAILHRHDHRRPGRRQHGHHEAGRAVARHRRQAHGDLPGGRRCRRACCNFLPGARRGDRRTSLVEHPDVALIAFTGSRRSGLAIHAPAAAGPARPARTSSASSPRWAARTPSSSTTTPTSTRPCRGVVAIGLRLPGAEVLGLLARHRAGAGLRRRSSPGWSRPRAACTIGPAEDPGTVVGPRDRRRGPRPHPALHRDRPQRRGARSWPGRRSAPWPTRATTSARTSSPT